MKRISYLLTALVFIAASSPAQKTFSDAGSWIPADFHPNATTLLIEKYPMSEKAEAKMEEYLTQTYPWAYEVVNDDIIRNTSGRYGDTVKYRFAFVWRTDNNKYGGPNDVDPNGNFYDRVKHKDYPTTKKINNYGQKSYVPFFNSIISHFP